MEKRLTMMYANIIEDMYEGMSIRMFMREDKGFFSVRVRVYQGLALNSYLFSLVTDEITSDIQN